MRGNDFLTLVIDELLSHFEYVLHCPGTIDRDPRSSPYKEGQEDADDQNLHGEKIRDGGSRIVSEEVLALFTRNYGMRADRRQNPSGNSAKVPVQEVRKKQFFCHSGIKLKLRSITAAPGSVQLVSGLNHDADRRNSEPDQEAVRAHGGTLEYSIAGDGDDAVAEQETQYQS